MLLELQVTLLHTHYSSQMAGCHMGFICLALEGTKKRQKRGTYLFLSNCCNYYRFVTYAIKRASVFLPLWIDVRQTLSKNEAEEAFNLWPNYLCAREWYKTSENSSVMESFCPIHREWTIKHPRAGLMHRRCNTGACRGCSQSELPVVTYWKWFDVFIRWWN